MTETYRSLVSRQNRLLDTPLRESVYFIPCSHADVAELADAQVSEACGGDTVMVRFHSSAFNNLKGES